MHLSLPAIPAVPTWPLLFVTLILGMVLIFAWRIRRAIRALRREAERRAAEAAKEIRREVGRQLRQSFVAGFAAGAAAAGTGCLVMRKKPAPPMMVPMQPAGPAFPHWTGTGAAA